MTEETLDPVAIDVRPSLPAAYSHAVPGVPLKGAFAGLALMFFLSGISAPFSGSLAAQEVQERVGFFLGRTSSRQLWSGSIGTEAVEGVSMGVFVDVPTPIPTLSIRAEAGYAGRGTIVWDDEADPDRVSDAKVRSHYLSLPVHGKVALGFGPLSFFAFGGPTMDILLDSGCTTHFCQVIREERVAVFGVGGGFGIGIDLPGGYGGGVELRFTEGLSDAYVGARDTARNRSREILVRVARPL
jgi:hypothetical protein